MQAETGVSCDQGVEHKERVAAEQTRNSTESCRYGRDLFKRCSFAIILSSAAYVDKRQKSCKKAAVLLRATLSDAQSPNFLIPNKVIVCNCELPCQYSPLALQLPTIAVGGAMPICTPLPPKKDKRKGRLQWSASEVQWRPRPHRAMHIY